MPRQKENLSRMHQSQKVLVVELFCLPYPMRRGSTLSTVLTATPDHKWQVTYSPFRTAILQPMRRSFQSHWFSQHIGEM